MDAPAGNVRLSVLLGQTGRPAVACVPRWVACRDSKNLPSSAIVAVSRLTIFGWPGRTVSEQPQYMTSLPLGGSAFISTGPSSSTRGAGFGFSGVSSFSVGASPVASGTFCNACCRFGLRLV